MKSIDNMQQKERGCEHKQIMPCGRYNNYKLLNAPISHIIQDVKVVELMKFLSPKKRRYLPMYITKNCKFCHDHGH